MNFNNNKILWGTILLLIIIATLLRTVVSYYYLDEFFKEGMVTLGTDLTATLDIPGATYCAPIDRDKVTPDCNNGIGIEPPAGYSKINVGTELKPVFKMKAIIPSGYQIDPSDKTKLLAKDNDTKYAVDSYRLATDEKLNMVSEDIPNNDYNVSNGFTAPLTKDYYRTITADTDAANPTTAIFTQGEKVMAVYKGGKQWFAGSVTTVNPNDTFKLTFDNGSVEDGIAKDKIRAIKYRQNPIPDPLPNGYELDLETGLLTFNLTLYALQTFQSTYDGESAKDSDFKYREDVSMNLGTYYQYDQNGNMIEIQNTEAQFSPVLYYVPGAYKFGSSNYIPNYEDSVYLSRTTRQSQTTPVYNTANILGGFCAQYKNDTNALEEKCAALDLNACASTSCCALLGGQKCVAGNENGPKNLANYTDYSLKNRDFYYYQGKCYGNCQNK
jgi:hypothetical protein